MNKSERLGTCEVLITLQNAKINLCGIERKLESFVIRDVVQARCSHSQRECQEPERGEVRVKAVSLSWSGRTKKLIYEMEESNS